MSVLAVRFTPDFVGWRYAARQLMKSGWAPEALHWATDAEGGRTALFAERHTSDLDLRLDGPDAGNTGLTTGQGTPVVDPTRLTAAISPAVLAPAASPPGVASAVSTPSEALLQRAAPPPTPATLRVSAEFLRLAELVAAHRSPERWGLLYRMLWRLANGTPHLLSLLADDDILAANRMAKAVGRDIHKMHAFVRFKQTSDGAFVAWHEPDHLIVRLAVPFFARRFRNQRWSILTPEASAYWDLSTLTFGPGVPASAAPQLDDQLEDLWCRYYGAVFNPARIKTKMMKSEMPVRYWKSLPETRQISRLLAEAPERLATMLTYQAPSVSQLVPPIHSGLEAIKSAALACRACAVCERTTQTVFGEGHPAARIVLVGEQPGDEEDRAGRPFIGPAGQLLDQALSEAGLDRRDLYVTNAVKHFKHTTTPKRRLHQKPSHADIAACKPWLEAELREVKPKFLVCLGASAAQSVLGRLVGVERERGRWLASGWTAHTLVTRHPAAILRAEAPLRAALYEELVADLRLVLTASLNAPS